MRFVALVIVLLSTPAAARTVRGHVFEDINGDGRPTAGERGIAKAVVAYDHTHFVETSASGEYVLEIPDQGGNGVVWVRVPDGYKPGPAHRRLPIDASRSVDIGLKPIPKHAGPITFIVASDTHIAPVMPFAGDLAAVAADAVALDPAPAFFTILGDITQGNTAQEFDLVDANLAAIEVPYVPVPGNHDWYDGGAMWITRYGPDNYSFDIANVHFVVWNMMMPLDDITRYLGAELSRVPPGMTVVAMTHAPPVPKILERLKELGVDYVLSGHTHTNRAVDHGGLVELTTEPLLMGGLDLMPAGYRVATIDRAGVMSTYHRTVVDAPQLSVISPAPRTCVPPSGGPLIVAAELDAGTATISARVDCGTRVELRYAGGWTWRADLPPLRPGKHSMMVGARTPTNTRITKMIAFDVCEPARAATPQATWPQLGGSPSHVGATQRALAPPVVQRWAATVGGHILHASPAIANGTVYVSATDLGDGKTGGLVALDLATGELRWRVATPKPVRGSPAVTNGVVAIGQLDGTVLGLDAQTGEKRWEYALGAGLAPEAASLFASPTADGNEFLIGNQRHLAALASSAGNATWRVDPVPGGAYSQSLAALAVDAGVAVGVFHRELGGLIAWDRALGTELWRTSGPLVTAINASPVIANETVYVVNGATEVSAFDLLETFRPGGTGPARPILKWTTKLDPLGFDWGNATVGSPAIANDVLVVPTLYRDLVALDAKTGGELWRFAGTPSQLRTTHYRGARESGFEASPVITGDIVWAVDTAGKLSALELATGKQLWSVDLETPVLAGLAVVDDWIVVASYDGSVRAFAHTAAPMEPAVVTKPPSCDVMPPTGCCDVRGHAGALPLAALVALLLTGSRRRRRRAAGRSAPT